MKHIRFGLPLFALLIGSFAPAQENSTKSEKVQLKRGQVMELSLLTPLDSRHTTKDDPVLLTLTHSLVADNVVVVPAGRIVRGRITSVARAMRDSHRAYLEWNVESVETISGTQVAVEPISKRMAKPKGKLVERVSLDPIPNTVVTPEHKPSLFSKATNSVEIVTALVLIPLIIYGSAKYDSCGSGCSNIKLRAGTHFYYAVSQDVSIAP